MLHSADAAGAPPLKAAVYQMVLHRPLEPARVTGDSTKNYWRLAYSALACFRIGMSRSASFQIVKNS